MTVEEAREVLGFRPEDTVLKSGLEPFKKAYKNIVKDPYPVVSKHEESV